MDTTRRNYNSIAVCVHGFFTTLVRWNVAGWCLLADNAFRELVVVQSIRTDGVGHQHGHSDETDTDCQVSHTHFTILRMTLHEQSGRVANVATLQPDTKSGTLIVGLPPMEISIVEGGLSAAIPSISTNRTPVSGDVAVNLHVVLWSPQRTSTVWSFSPWPFRNNDPLPRRVCGSTRTVSCEGRIENSTGCCPLVGKAIAASLVAIFRCHDLMAAVTFTVAVTTSRSPGSAQVT